MAEELHKRPDSDLLPLHQRLAWMAGIWLLSVGAMALVSLVIRAWLT